jgi:S-formylglutathione hydrolase FrmB
VFGFPLTELDVPRSTSFLFRACLLACCFIGSIAWGSQAEKGTTLTETMRSAILLDNRISIDPNRSVRVYLPAGYATSKKAYPVAYYLHNFWWSPDGVFNENHVPELLDRAFASGTVEPFILVAADYRMPTTTSLYENSPINGRWLDFTTQELVPFIDRRFRTLAHRDSRAIVGDFFGARGALRFAMLHPEIFSVAYAIHPVATSGGALPWSNVQIDWRRIHAAKSFEDLRGDGRAEIFVTVSQAFLPNPNRPPFYCDFFVEMENGQPTVNFENLRKSQKGFHLDESLDQYASNLRQLRGLGIEWGRYDPTTAHVDSNRLFSRMLDDRGIEHEAEEFRGGVSDKTWGDEGRFYTRVLPFLGKHLVFER